MLSSKRRAKWEVVSTDIAGASYLERRLCFKVTNLYCMETDGFTLFGVNVCTLKSLLSNENVYFGCPEVKLQPLAVMPLDLMAYNLCGTC